MSECRSWVDVDLAAIAHNVGVIRGAVAPSAVIAVVKADGYGHGAVPVAAAALDAGAAALAVAIVAEGVELRDAGIDSRILVLSEPRADELPECVAFGLEPALYTSDGVAGAAKVAADHGRVVDVHVKVDTGMHRVGATPADALRIAEAVTTEPSLSLGSIWTHCAVADEPDDPFTRDQLARYDAVLADAAARGIEVPWRHAANSAGALCHPAARYDVVRAGIATYGVAPAPGLSRCDGVDDLRPALSWKARVSFVKTVPAGDRISYGLRHRFERDAVVATVPVGYADGVARRWSSPEVGGEVVIGGQRRPVVGVVTMDQLMVDCGDLPVAAGDEVELIGPTLTAEEWGERLGTIAYEIVCGIGPRRPPEVLVMKKKRLALAAAMGIGLGAAGALAARSAVRRTAAHHRAHDPNAVDADAFDLDKLGVRVHTLPSHDGGVISVVEKGPSGARPLVLLHGITLAARVWGYQLRDLSDRFRVLAVDLRGHGSSTAGDAGFGLTLLAEDLRTTLEALDLHDAIVVGHSMGGMTLMQFCGDHPDVLDERVAGVVFLATAPIIPLPLVVQRALKRVSPAIQRRGDSRGWDSLARYRMNDNDLSYVLTRRAFGRNPSHTHIELTRQLGADCAPATLLPSGLGLVVHDAEEALAKTKTPSLVIGGELDNLTPIAMSHRIAELLPDTELHVLPDAGHMLMLERPQEVEDLLDRFAKRLAS